MLAFCNHRGIFTAYELGWPGLVNDATMFNECAVWLKCIEHFETDEYILVDKGIVLIIN